MSKVRVRIASKKRNASGWHVILGHPSQRVWFKHKPQAIRALRMALSKLTFAIVPAPPRHKPKTESTWLL